MSLIFSSLPNLYFLGFLLLPLEPIGLRVGGLPWMAWAEVTWLVVFILDLLNLCRGLDLWLTIWADLDWRLYMKNIFQLWSIFFHKSQLYYRMESIVVIYNYIIRTIWIDLIFTEFFSTILNCIKWLFSVRVRSCSKIM